MRGVRAPPSSHLPTSPDARCPAHLIRCILLQHVDCCVACRHPSLVTSVSSPSPTPFPSEEIIANCRPSEEFPCRRQINDLAGTFLPFSPAVIRGVVLDCSSLSVFCCVQPQTRCLCEPSYLPRRWIESGKAMSVSVTVFSLRVRLIRLRAVRSPARFLCSLARLLLCG